jgi:hypothetical protein
MILGRLNSRGWYNKYFWADNSLTSMKNWCVCYCKKTLRYPRMVYVCKGYLSGAPSKSPYTQILDLGRSVWLQKIDGLECASMQQCCKKFNCKSPKYLQYWFLVMEGVGRFLSVFVFRFLYFILLKQNGWNCRHNSVEGLNKIPRSLSKHFQLIKFWIWFDFRSFCDSNWTLVPYIAATEQGPLYQN